MNPPIATRFDLSGVLTSGMRKSSLSQLKVMLDNSMQPQAVI